MAQNFVILMVASDFRIHELLYLGYRIEIFFRKIAHIFLGVDPVKDRSAFLDIPGDCLIKGLYLLGEFLLVSVISITLVFGINSF